MPTALDAVFGPSQWLQPKPGAQVLFTLPRPGASVLPGTWHMDCGFERPSWPAHGVKLFAFFGEVGPKGGGTMILPGTHRVVDELPLRPPSSHGYWHGQLAEAPQPTSFPGAATQRPSDTRPGPVAGRPGRRRQRGPTSDARQRRSTGPRSSRPRRRDAVPFVGSKGPKRSRRRRGGAD